MTIQTAMAEHVSYLTQGLTQKTDSQDNAIQVLERYLFGRSGRLETKEKTLEETRRLCRLWRSISMECSATSSGVALF